MEREESKVVARPEPSIMLARRRNRVPRGDVLSRHDRGKLLIRESWNRVAEVKTDGEPRRFLDSPQIFYLASPFPATTARGDVTRRPR